MWSAVTSRVSGLVSSKRRVPWTRAAGSARTTCRGSKRTSQPHEGVLTVVGRCLDAPVELFQLIGVEQQARGPHGRPGQDVGLQGGGHQIVLGDAEGRDDLALGEVGGASRDRQVDADGPGAVLGDRAVVEEPVGHTAHHRALRGEGYHRGPQRFGPLVDGGLVRVADAQVDGGAEGQQDQQNEQNGLAGAAAALPGGGAAADGLGRTRPSVPGPRTPGGGQHGRTPRRRRRIGIRPHRRGGPRASPQAGRHALPYLQGRSAEASVNAEVRDKVGRIPPSGCPWVTPGAARLGRPGDSRPPLQGHGPPPLRVLRGRRYFGAADRAAGAWTAGVAGAWAAGGAGFGLGVSTPVVVGGGTWSRRLAAAPR